MQTYQLGPCNLTCSPWGPIIPSQDHLCPKYSFLKALSNPKWAPGLLTTQTSKPSLGDALPLKGITLIAA